MPPVLRLAKDLEARAKAGDPTGMAELLIALEVAVEDIRSELDETAAGAAVG